VQADLVFVAKRSGDAALAAALARVEALAALPAR